MTPATALPAHLLTISEVAAWLGVTVRHVRRLVAERRIPYIKWGRYLRFDVDDITAWLAISKIRFSTGGRLPLYALRGFLDVVHVYDENVSMQLDERTAAEGSNDVVQPSFDNARAARRCGCCQSATSSSHAGVPDTVCE